MMNIQMLPNKKAAIYGVVGVLLSCMIIASVAMTPWSNLEKMLGLPSVPPDVMSRSLDVRVFVSNLTEPLGVGSEGDVTFAVTSTRNVSDISVRFELLRVCSGMPLGISYIDGISENITWTGDLRANISMIFNARIKANEVGYAVIRITLTKVPDGFLVKLSDVVWLLVFEDDIQVSREWIIPPGALIPYAGNSTLPQTNSTIFP